MSQRDNDKIKNFAEAYLNIVPEATASQIALHLHQGSYTFHGGKPSKQKVASVLTASSIFVSDKYKDGLQYFSVANK